jgi:hypothetical protein
VIITLYRTVLSWVLLSYMLIYFARSCPATAVIIAITTIILIITVPQDCLDCQTPTRSFRLWGVNLSLSRRGLLRGGGGGPRRCPLSTGCQRCIAPRPSCQGKERIRVAMHGSVR